MELPVVESGGTVKYKNSGDASDTLTLTKPTTIMVTAGEVRIGI